MNCDASIAIYLLIKSCTGSFDKQSYESRYSYNGCYELLAISNALCPEVESVLPGASDDEMLGGISSSPKPDCSNCNANNLSSSSCKTINSN